MTVSPSQDAAHIPWDSCIGDGKLDWIGPLETLGCIMMDTEIGNRQDELCLSYFHSCTDTQLGSNQKLIQEALPSFYDITVLCSIVISSHS